MWERAWGNMWRRKAEQSRAKESEQMSAAQIALHIAINSSIIKIIQVLSAHIFHWNVIVISLIFISLRTEIELSFNDSVAASIAIAFAVLIPFVTAACRVVLFLILSKN